MTRMRPLRLTPAQRQAANVARFARIAQGDDEHLPAGVVGERDLDGQWQMHAAERGDEPPTG